MMIFDLNETSASILFLVFMMVFFLLALGGIFTGKRKLVSGINLNWSIWSFPAFLPLCVTLYSKYLDWKYPYNYQKPYIKHPNQQWIDRNWENIFYVNIILVLIFILILIPIIKKWKAMPEE